MLVFEIHTIDVFNHMGTAFHIQSHLDTDVFVRRSDGSLEKEKDLGTVWRNPGYMNVTPASSPLNEISSELYDELQSFVESYKQKTMFF